MIFEMTQEQLDKIIEASKPVPMSAQENADAAWDELGKEMRFKPETVKPIAGRGDRFFSADPVLILVHTKL